MILNEYKNRYGSVKLRHGKKFILFGKKGYYVITRLSANGVRGKTCNYYRYQDEAESVFKSLKALLVTQENF